MGKNLPERKQVTFTRLERNVPRNEMVQLLQVSADPRVQQLIEYLLSSNPEIMKCSLPMLAARCRLSHAELVREIAKSRVSEGVLRMSKHMPRVLEDTAIDARSTLELCDLCQGTGQVIAFRPGKDDVYRNCRKCNGKGKVRKVGDIDARKLVFEAAGLTNKKGPAVNVNVNPMRGDMPTLESEMVGLDRVLEIQPEPATKP